MLSVIIPAYDESENVEPITARLVPLLEKEQIPFELLFVDDGSKDDTFSKINALSERDERVRGISFSRNFGKEAAIFAGLGACKGDCAVLIDSDMQHPPEKIPEMYRLWEQGYEVIEGVKSSRGDERTVGSLFARIFYKLISHWTGIDMNASSDFKLLDRRVIDVLLTLPEKNTFFRALTFWVGFKTTKVEYAVEPRLHGRSKWSFGKLCRYAVSNIASFTSAPLTIVFFLGMVFMVFALAVAVEALVRYFNGTAASGFTTVILLQLITGGMVMICLGIIGYYISRIYDEVKGRPTYIIADRTGEDKLK